ncbi:MAG TPA: acyl-CoA dehydrogenase family protein [Candidatus Binataceae bacterium]|nr:acyl-CoA dehydrogenase family protein [Candidatus Binataceae bacterium]
MVDDIDQSTHPILETARALAPQIRAAAPAIEQGRRLTPAIVQALKEAGIFGMTMPRAWGGPEVDPLMQIRVIEALAEADGSVGWCAMINSDGGFYSAFLEDAIGRAMYRDREAPTGSSLIFIGGAEKVDGGYRVKGRWPFVSGCQHSDWIAGTCTVYENGAPRMIAEGIPERRVCFLPAAQCEVLDTWNTTGLRGSGSHDVAINDVFVPAERSAAFPFHSLRSGPLYAWPMMFVYNAPGVTLGIARGAINTFSELAARKTTTMSMATGRPVMLRDEGYAQAAIARAEALVGSARAYVFDRIGDIWQSLVAGERLSIQQRALYRIAMAHAHAACLEAVEGLYKVIGGSAVYASGPFDRPLRDLITINQHTVNSPKIQETTGKVLLGFDVRDPLI